MDISRKPIGFVCFDWGSVGQSAAQGIINGITDAIGAARSKRAQNRAFAQQLKFWNMQNEYNLPANQRKRLEDAGLNPALMYEGGGAANTAGELSSVPQDQYAGRGFNGGDQLDIMTQAAQIEVLKSQAEKNNAEAARARGETLGEGVRDAYVLAQTDLLNQQGAGQKLRNEVEAFDLELKKDMRQMTIDQARADLNVTKKTYWSIVESIEKSQLDRQVAGVYLKEATIDYYIRQLEYEYFLETGTTMAEEQVKVLRSEISERTANTSYITSETDRGWVNTVERFGATAGTIILSLAAGGGIRNVLRGLFGSKRAAVGFKTAANSVVKKNAKTIGFK